MVEAAADSRRMRPRRCETPCGGSRPRIPAPGAADTPRRTEFGDVRVGACTAHTGVVDGSLGLWEHGCRSHADNVNGMVSG